MYYTRYSETDRLAFKLLVRMSLLLRRSQTYILAFFTTGGFSNVSKFPTWEDEPHSLPRVQVAGLIP